MEIKVVKGEVSVNVTEPYFISLKSAEEVFSKDKVLGAVYPSLENLLVIDTRANIEDIHKYKSVALLTKNYLVVIKDDRDRIESYSLSQVDNVTITKDTVSNLTNKIAPYLNFFLPAAAISVFVGMFVFIPFGNLVYLIFFSLVLLVVAKIFSVSLKFAKAYQLGLHLIILPTTFLGILSLFGVRPDFPFLKTIAMLIFALVVFKKLKEGLGKNTI